MAGEDRENRLVGSSADRLDLRHAEAIHAVMFGENLPLVGGPLGHRRLRTTAGYVHLADGHLVEAAEEVGAAVATAMPPR